MDKCNYDDLSNVSKDDLQYAVCALNSLLIFDAMSIRKLASLEEGKKPFLVTDPKWQMEESLRRWQACMDKHPKEWLGEYNDPKNEDNGEKIVSTERKWGIMKKIEKVRIADLFGLAEDLIIRLKMLQDKYGKDVSIENDNQDGESADFVVVFEREETNSEKQDREEREKYNQQKEEKELARHKERQSLLEQKIALLIQQEEIEEKLRRV